MKPYFAPKNPDLVCPVCRPKEKQFTEKRGLRKHLLKEHPHADIVAILAPLRDRCPSCRKVISAVSQHKKTCKKHQAVLKRFFREQAAREKSPEIQSSNESDTDAPKVQKPRKRCCIVFLFNIRRDFPSQFATILY